MEEVDDGCKAYVGMADFHEAEFHKASHLCSIYCRNTFNFAVSVGLKVYRSTDLAVFTILLSW